MIDRSVFLHSLAVGKELDEDLVLEDDKVTVCVVFLLVCIRMEVALEEPGLNDRQIVRVLDHQVIEAEKLQCLGIIDSVCEAVVAAPLRCTGVVLVIVGALERLLLEVLQVDGDSGVVDIQDVCGRRSGGWK